VWSYIQYVRWDESHVHLNVQTFYAFTGILEDAVDIAGMASWKIGDYCPKLWQNNKYVIYVYLYIYTYTCVYMYIHIYVYIDIDVDI